MQREHDDFTTPAHNSMSCTSPRAERNKEERRVTEPGDSSAPEKGMQCLQGNNTQEKFICGIPKHLMQEVDGDPVSSDDDMDGTCSQPSTPNVTRARPSAANMLKTRARPPKIKNEEFWKLVLSAIRSSEENSSRKEEWFQLDPLDDTPKVNPKRLPENSQHKVPQEVQQQDWSKIQQQDHQKVSHVDRSGSLPRFSRIMDLSMPWCQVKMPIGRKKSLSRPEDCSVRVLDKRAIVRGASYRDVRFGQSQSLRHLPAPSSSVSKPPPFYPTPLRVDAEQQNCCFTMGQVSTSRGKRSRRGGRPRRFRGCG